MEQVQLFDIKEVRERWKLRNGSFAIISHRMGSTCAGHIEGSRSLHCWTAGKTEAGAGYDLVKLTPKETNDLPQT